VGYAAPMQPSITELCGRLERWLAAHAPHLLESLNPGADPLAVEQLERDLALALPADFRAWLLLHDGQQEEAPGLMEGYTLLPAEQIGGEWQIYNELAGLEHDMRYCRVSPGILPVWHSPARVPVAFLGSSEWYMLDLDPAPGGTRGQIFWRDKSGDAELLAAGFGPWLEGLVRDLEGGALGLDVEGLLERR
jgi:cell wall assembly regulator SMI1